jgi:D-glycero-D-manno-heptose 1,7-bisphosphate phosphatase
LKHPEFGVRLSRKFVVLDRDGTLIEHVHYLSDPKLVRFKPDLISALAALGKEGFGFGIVTNQSIIGRALASQEEVGAVNQHIVDFLEQNDINISFLYVCPHVPEDYCKCRKPEIGFGLRAISEFDLSPSLSYVIGDQESDILFGKNLGCTPIQVQGIANRSHLAEYYAHSLSDAADWILGK